MFSAVYVRRNRFVLLALALLMVVLALLLACYPQARPVVKVGVLYSLAGTMPSGENPWVNALQPAIAEANATGGIAGRRIVVVDCQADAAYCALQAERLITLEKVSALFGCRSYSCRKALEPVLEKYRNLLFYPVQYEGLEQSSNIIYTGAPPNQQIIPAVDWALDRLGKRVYLVGSDDVFPRMANSIIRDLLKIKNGVLAGESYVPDGGGAMDALVAGIIRRHPDVVMNTLKGDSNFAFFEALNKAGIGAEKMPVLSFGIAELELGSLATLETAGHYAAWNYFQSIPSAQNRIFVENYHKQYGPHAVIEDAMEAS